MSLRLPGPLADDIRRHGEAAYPAECCGALVGRVEAEGKEVVRLAAAVNRRTDDPHRYLIAPDDLRRGGGGGGGGGREKVGGFN